MATKWINDWRKKKKSKRTSTSLQQLLKERRALTYVFSSAAVPVSLSVFDCHRHLFTCVGCARTKCNNFRFRWCWLSDSFVVMHAGFICKKKKIRKKEKKIKMIVIKYNIWLEYYWMKLIVNDSLQCCLNILWNLFLFPLKLFSLCAFNFNNLLYCNTFFKAYLNIKFRNIF